MILLTLAVLFSTLNHMLFKAFSRFNITLPVAVSVNYAVCVIVGSLSSADTPFLTAGITQHAWFPYSILQGGLLFGSFLSMGYTTYRCGVSTASLAARLSVAIPTIAAFFLYADSLTAAKICGIAAALWALYLSCVSPSVPDRKLPDTTLPLGLFILSGLQAALLKFVQFNFLGQNGYHEYVTVSFLFAFSFSAAFVTFRILKRFVTLNQKDLAAGCALGCINYGAVFLLIKTLGQPGWESSRVFPTISILVVAASSLSARLFFKEPISRRLIAAMVIGGIAILLVNI